MAKIKFRQAMKIARDKRQEKLVYTERDKKLKKKQLVTMSEEQANEIVTCPFCLHISKLLEFTIQIKTGVSLSNAKCPECNKGMRMTSLTTPMTIEEFAEWVFDYVPDGYWQKIPWKKWSSRLYNLGWSHRFWKRYKELKAEHGVESYEDHIMRQQYEEAEEQGWIEE